MPKVSVIIPTYNRSEYIQHSVQSVLSQTYRDVEIIVCDDASTDNTVEVVRSIQVKSSLPIKIEVLPFNLGVSAARNKAIFLAEGELIAFLDSDDIWKQDKLEKQVDFLDHNQEYIGVGCGFEIEKNGLIIDTKFGNDYQLHKNSELFQLLYDCYISTPCFVVRKEVLFLAGLFDIALKSSEDRDLWWRLPRFGQIGLINELLVRITKHSYSISNTRNIITGMTYIPVVKKTVWYWSNSLTNKERNLIVAKAFLISAYDAYSSNRFLNCIFYASQATKKRFKIIKSIKLICKCLLRLMHINIFKIK